MFFSLIAECHSHASVGGRATCLWGGLKCFWRTVKISCVCSSVGSLAWCVIKLLADERSSQSPSGPTPVQFVCFGGSGGRGCLNREGGLLNACALPHFRVTTGSIRIRMMPCLSVPTRRPFWTNFSLCITIIALIPCPTHAQVCRKYTLHASMACVPYYM